MEGQSDENFDNFDWLYDEEDESSEEFFAQRFFDFPLAPIYNQRHPLGRGSGDDQSNSGSDSSSQEDGLPDHVGIGNLSVDTDVVTDSEGYEDSFIDDEEEESWSGDNSGDNDVVPLEDEDRPTRGGPPPRWVCDVKVLDDCPDWIMDQGEKCYEWEWRWKWSACFYG